MSDTMPDVVLKNSDMTNARPRVRSRRFRPSGSAFVMALYLLFLMLPIYWLLNMSLKTNAEILGAFSLWPRNFTLANYELILTDPSWYMGYVNSIIYVVMNMVLSLAVALPAAYAFSRYSFIGYSTKLNTT
jgi:glycerol transport system permease protein